MNYETQVLALIREGNPIQDPDTLTVDQSDSAVYLATLEQRSSEVTQLDTRPEKTDSSSRNRWIAVAATIVAVVGAGVILLTRTNEEAPVATDPPVTTLVVPTTQAPTNTEVVPTTEAEVALDPVVEENLAAGVAFLEAFTSGDLETAEQSAVGSQLFFGVVGGLDRIAEEHAWLDAVGWTVTVEECAVTVDDPANTWITCTVGHENAWAEALSFGSFTSEYRLRINKGEHAPNTPEYQGLEQPTVTSVEAQALPFEFRSEVWQVFTDWLRTQHPDDAPSLLTTNLNTGGYFPNEMPRASLEEEDLWRQRSDEFVAAQG